MKNFKRRAALLSLMQANAGTLTKRLNGHQRLVTKVTSRNKRAPFFGVKGLKREPKPSKSEFKGHSGFL